MGACPLSVPRTFAIRRTKASTGLDFVRADNEQERGQETELFPISDTPGGSVESSSEVTDRDHRLHHRCCSIGSPQHAGIDQEFPFSKELVSDRTNAIKFPIARFGSSTWSPQVGAGDEELSCGTLPEEVTFKKWYPFCVTQLAE